eukprot:scaffold2071_cov190-Alexandrium_tamarense.AAC.34
MRQFSSLQILLLLWCLTCRLLHAEITASDESKGYRIATIGGGISGTFTAKYLAEYDVGTSRDCSLDEIVVYDVSPPPPPRDEQAQTDGDTGTIQSSSDPRPKHWQGSRVSSITLSDGSTIELGASIIYSGNQLVVDMIQGDKEYLVKGKPMSTGKTQSKDTSANNKQEAMMAQEPSGFGIYHGNQEWLLKPSPFSSYPLFLQSILKPLYFIWRYNIDLFRLRQAVQRAIHAFDIVYELLNDTSSEVTYFESPMEMWEAIGLRSAAGITFHDFLDGLGLSRDRSLELGSDDVHDVAETGWWNFNWRKWIPGMGCLRSELVTAMAINTYNQDLNQLNGRDLFSIEGGNHKLMDSALYQAAKLYESSKCEPKQRIQRHQKQITAVVSDENSMELLSNEESLGTFDIVILAAPLQQSRIQFLTYSPMALDRSILYPMPLGGVHDNLDSEEDDAASSGNNEHGQRSFALPLPSSATTPYTSVVSTVVSNATLNGTHFGLSNNEPWPRSILVSERGKLLEGITTLTILSADAGLIKTFSSEELSTEQRNILFGPYHIVEYEQSWGGGREQAKDGGATPNFGGGRRSDSLPYIVYQGSKHWGKTDGKGPALYYVNAIESSVAAIEISAIGSKSTAKLVARQLGLISPWNDRMPREEL